jgi:prepilin-type N-terminal cleavage/methylation domain-containing protein
MISLLSRMKGFTLVETLVAITILTLAVVAPFQAIQNSINASRVAKEKLVASGLAQEALEYVRFIRLNNYLANPGSYKATILNGMNGTNGPNCVGAGNNCTVDASVAPPGFASCGGVCPVLQLDPAGTGVYTQAAIGHPTIYRRSINITATPNVSEQVTVTITWNDRGAQTMVLQETMYDWL